MTTSDIELLRLYVNDPAGSTQRFTGSQLQDFMDRFGDLHATAAEVWDIKAATVAEWYTSNTDGAFLDRGAVYDHCKEMATYHRLLGGGGAAFDSIQLETATTSSVDLSSEF